MKPAGADLRWRRDGADWILLHGRRRVGRVIPDAKWPGMFRSVMSGGLSDLAGLAWAKSAVLDAVAREIEYTAPSKSPAKEGSFSGQKPAHASNRVGAHR
jgi:hypothetical protein